MLKTTHGKLFAVKAATVVPCAVFGIYASLGLFKYSVSFASEPLARLPGLESNAGSMIYPITAWIITLALVILLAILGRKHMNKTVCIIAAVYTALGYPLLLLSSGGPLNQLTLQNCLFFINACAFTLFLLIFIISNIRSLSDKK